MPIYREDQVNVLGITNPGTYILERLPTGNIVGRPTNIEARVGVASWGPVNAVARGSSYDDSVSTYGPAVARPHDLSKNISAMTQGGKALNWAGVRVTDGTDVAASVTLPSNFGTAVAVYTGSYGNKISLAFQATAAIGAIAAVVSFPGRSPERFDNIYPSLASLTVVPGTGYTRVPTIVLTAPQAQGGVQATAAASLKAVGTPTVSAGGTGYVVGDTITLGSGVVVTVATVTSGAVSTVTLTNPGSIVSGPVPATVGQQVATSGNGTGAAFTLSFGLGPATITPGSGYTSTPTLTLSGGGGGTGGSYTPVVSMAAGVQQVINSGNLQRPRSRYIVFTAGTGTGSPALGTPYALTGGTDGAGGVGLTQLLGSDVVPGTGMYAFRGLRGDEAELFTVPDTLVLGDLTDTSVWATMLAFGTQEAIYPLAAMAPGSSVADAVAARQAQGIDDPSFKILVGDWPTVYIDGIGNILVSPAAVAQGLYGNLSPEQGSINKPLYGVSATLTSQTGVLTSDAVEAVAQTGGVDFIGRSSALGQDFFSLMTGRNTSSNTQANGDEFTRLTNFLARSLQSAATRSIVGKLQSVRPDDPTRIKAKAVLDSFGATLVDPSSGSDGYGLIDAYATKCDNDNNQPATVRRGFLFAVFTAQYLNVIRYFVIRLAANGTVNVTVQATQPTAVSIAALAA